MYCMLSLILRSTVSAHSSKRKIGALGCREAKDSHLLHSSIIKINPSSQLAVKEGSRVVFAIVCHYANQPQRRILGPLIIDLMIQLQEFKRLLYY